MEQAGAHRPFRILQKRGVFVDCEDFLPVTATYPDHPLKKVVPNARNLEDLKQQRLAAKKKIIDEKMSEFEKRAHTKSALSQRIPDEGYVAEPKYTSVHQRKDEELRAARTKVGLTEVTEQPKEVAGEINLRWSY